MGKLLRDAEVHEREYYVPEMHPAYCQNFGMCYVELFGEDRVRFYHLFKRTLLAEGHWLDDYKWTFVENPIWG